MARDSLGPIGKSLTITPRATSLPSVIESALAAKVGSPLTLDALTGQLNRLEAAWGAPKDRTPAQFVGMAREWFVQLHKFGTRTVEQAITHVIGANKFQWTGAIAEVVAFCNRDHAEWREVVVAQLPPPTRQDPEPFERDGRTTAEEIEFRAKQIAEWKQAAGLKSMSEVIAEENSNRAKTVSPAMLEGASPEFLELIGQGKAGA